MKRIHLASSILIFFYISISAQTRIVNNWSFGYYPSIPKALIGISCAKLSSVGMGYFLNVKWNGINVNKDELYDNIDEYEARNTLGDSYQSSKDGLIDIEFGIILPQSAESYFAVGIGIVEKTTYLQFYDHFHILGKGGTYWIRKGDASTEFGLNGAYIYYPEGNTAFTIGLDTNPGGICLGVAWVISFQ